MKKFLTFSLIILSSLTAKSQSFYNNNKFSFNDSILIFGFQDSIIKYLPFVLKNKTFEQVQDFKIIIDTVSGNFNTFRAISKNTLEISIDFLKRFVDLNLASFLSNNYWSGTNNLLITYFKHYNLINKSYLDFIEIDGTDIEKLPPEWYSRFSYQVARSLLFIYLHEISHIANDDTKDIKILTDKILDENRINKKNKLINDLDIIENKADNFAFHVIGHFGNDTILASDYLGILDIYTFADPLKLITDQSSVDRVTSIDRSINLLQKHIHRIDCANEYNNYCNTLNYLLQYRISVKEYYEKNPIIDKYNKFLKKEYIPADSLLYMVFIDYKLNYQSNVNFTEIISDYLDLNSRISTKDNNNLTDKYIKEYCYFMVAQIYENKLNDIDNALKYYQLSGEIKTYFPEEFYKRIIYRLSKQ